MEQIGIAVREDIVEVGPIGRLIERHDIIAIDGRAA